LVIESIHELENARLFIAFLVWSLVLIGFCPEKVRGSKYHSLNEVSDTKRKNRTAYLSCPVFDYFNPLN